VSQQIRGLEEQLGFELFERRGRRVVLNPAGQALLRSVQTALTLLDDGVQAAAAAAGSESQRLRVTVLPSFANRWLLPRMGSWRDSHPSLPLEIEASFRTVDLQREGFHAAVRQGKGPWPGLESERLFEQPPIIIVGSPSAARRLLGAQPEALVREPLLGDSDLWKDWFAAAGLRTNVRTVADFNDAGLMLQAAEQSLGSCADARIARRRRAVRRTPGAAVADLDHAPGSASLSSGVSAQSSRLAAVDDVSRLAVRRTRPLAERAARERRPPARRNRARRARRPHAKSARRAPRPWRARIAAQADANRDASPPHLCVEFRGRRTCHGRTPQSHHHLCDHRVDPYAVDVAVSAGHAEEIADAAVAAAEAGAAIVHLHARDPVDGRPTQDPKYFREFAPDIKRRSDVVINFTTGGAATMTIEERLQPALAAQARGRLAQHGLDEFRLYPMLKRFTTFKHEWEREYLQTSDSRCSATRSRISSTS
jgi:DNA-binding transcriptional LysR family regulator